MAVATGLVLAGPVLTVAFTSAHAQVINNERWPGKQLGEQSTAAATRQSHALVLITAGGEV